MNTDPSSHGLYTPLAELMFVRTVKFSSRNPGAPVAHRHIRK
jgi:hypothetical protein